MYLNGMGLRWLTRPNVPEKQKHPKTENKYNRERRQDKSAATTETKHKQKLNKKENAGS